MEISRKHLMTAAVVLRAALGRALLTELGVAGPARF